VGLLLLLIACVNYMNLATARSTKRAREVGMRKVLGASRAQLIVQFIGESVFYTLLSLLLALLLCGALLRFTPLSTLLGAPLTMQPLFSPLVFSSLLLGALALGVLSGLYPAFYLSSMPPIAAFRGAGGTRKAGTSLRKMLVTVQFAISVTVVACTLLMLAQMQFINSKELGFDDQNRIVLRVAGADQVERLPALIDELEQQPGVLAAGRTQHLPGQNVGLNAIQVENDEGVMQQRTLNVMNVRPGLIDTLRGTITCCDALMKAELWRE